MVAALLAVLLGSSALGLTGCSALSDARGVFERTARSFVPTSTVRADTAPAASRIPIAKPSVPETPPVSAPPVTFKFRAGTYTLAPLVYEADYRKALADRQLHTLLQDTGWGEAVATYMVDAPHELRCVDAVARDLRTLRDQMSLDADGYLELIVAYVQQIPYVEVTDDPRFATEVIMEARGDCDDKVFLLASLLRHEGYKSAVIDLGDHMALGVPTNGTTFGHTGYGFVETTEPHYIGEATEAASDVIGVYSISGGTKGYSAGAQVDAIDAADSSASTTIDQLDKQLKRKLSRRKYNALVDRYNLAVDTFNFLEEHAYDRPHAYQVATGLASPSP